MITDSVLRRTLLLRFGNSSGTGFLIDKDGKQYLVTARHVVEGFKNGHELAISYQGNWANSLPVLIGHGTDDVDISVLALGRVIVKVRNMLYEENKKDTLDVGGCVLGQDVYFLGFPFGLYSDFGEMNLRFPYPIVKKAIFSGAIKNINATVNLLDGINNLGFSGGPVLYRNPSNFKSQLYIFSVVSGYRSHGADVYHKKERTSLYVQENTGIIISYAINHALDIIDANPIGAPL